MAEFFEILGAVALVALIACVVAVAALMHRLTRANRVAPGRRSAAPLTWLLSPGAPARLHRRLRRAVTVANLSAAMAPAAFTLGDVAGELVARAVTIDDVLVSAYGLHPEVRHPRLVRLTADVREIEGAAARLHQQSGDWRRYLDQSVAPTAVAPPTLQERLDSVEAALNELPSQVSAPPPRLTR